MAEDVILLEKDGLAAEVSPLGGAVLSARWRGIPILAPTPSPGLASQVLGQEACFPLVPFGNRIEANAFSFEGRDYALSPNTADPLVLHGDGWLRRWTVLRQDRDRVVLRYRQQASAATPFAYEAMETVAIGPESLTLSLAVTNHAACRLPYGLGFHPYFPRTPGTRLFARAERYWSEREQHLPGQPGAIPTDADFTAGVTLPARWLNNVFDGWDGRARIEWPETNLTLSIEAAENLRFFVLYSPSGDAGSFCLEPMTHRPNAHRHGDDGGLTALAPGEQLSTWMTLRLRANPAA